MRSRGVLRCLWDPRVNVARVCRQVVGGPSVYVCFLCHVAPIKRRIQGSRQRTHTASRAKASVSTVSTRSTREGVRLDEEQSRRRRSGWRRKTSVMLAYLFFSVGFSLRGPAFSSGRRVGTLTASAESAVPSEYQSESSALDAARAALNLPFERDELKRKLLRVCAVCNRGFGASTLDRSNVDSLLEQLISLNPCVEPTAGVTGCASGVEWIGRGFENRDDYENGFTVGAQGPLDGVWRLVYTNATDVLSLDVNPIAGVGPIWQEVTLPDRVVNVIGELHTRCRSLARARQLWLVASASACTRAPASPSSSASLPFSPASLSLPHLMACRPVPARGEPAAARDAAYEHPASGGHQGARSLRHPHRPHV